MKQLTKRKHQHWAAKAGILPGKRQAPGLQLVSRIVLRLTGTVVEVFCVFPLPLVVSVSSMVTGCSQAAEEIGSTLRLALIVQ